MPPASEHLAGDGPFDIVLSIRGARFAPEFATADRPAYDATSGYSGTHLLASLSKRFPSYWVGAYVRYDTLAGATFADSPLVRRQNSLAGGFGIAWMIGDSKKMVNED
jgi:outer membrane protein